MYFGINDNNFTRNLENEAVVPMTKSEIRAVYMSKLQTEDDSVCWDIGAGTGSVSVEMALAAPRGKVFAVEMKDDAADLIRENLRRFSVSNAELITGKAPEACRDLPSPDRVFIGGSSGNIREIIACVLEKNQKARIVAAAVSLETIAELTACMKEFAFSETEAVSVQVSGNKTAGDYNLMIARNPVYIFTMQR